MTNLKTIAVGEFLWDYLPKGKKIGGAAANFCYHAKSVGAQAILVSAVGQDDNGKELLEQLDILAIPHDVQISTKYETGKVMVELDAAGKPTYNILDPVAWDDIQLTESLKHLLHEEVVAIYFGSLIQRNHNNHQLLKTIIADLPATVKVIVDINLRQNHYNDDILHFSVAHSHILKLNDEELPVIARLLNIDSDPQQLFKYLNQHYQLELLIYTCGGEGSYLISQTEQDHCPAEKITPVDTVGAGDSFMATASMLYLQGKSLKEINIKANHIAAYVCTQSGPMPKIPAELIKDLTDHN